MDVAHRSGLSNYLCQHIRSATYATSTAKAESLSLNVLNEMVTSKWFGQGAKMDCLKRQQLAFINSAPLSVETICVSETKKCISLYEPTVSHHSQVGRVTVVYDTKMNRWSCPCTNLRRSCIHSYIAKWHLFQTQRSIFRTVRSTEEVVIENVHRSDEDSSPIYPPRGAVLQKMVSYIKNKKKILSILPENVRHPVPDREYPRRLVPDETLCQKCVGTVPLSDPVLITKKAKILTNWCVIEGTFSYLSVSSVCNYCNVNAVTVL